MGWYDAGLRRYVRRRVPEARGRLVWVDDTGEVHDLGTWSVAQLVAFDTAVNIAYRTTPERSEKVRLAAIRLQSARLVRALQATRK